jgi:hypothetical protein
VDVRPLVVADAEAAELIQPSKGTLDDPAPPAQATPMRSPAHGQQGHDVASPESAEADHHDLFGVVEIHAFDADGRPKNVRRERDRQPETDGSLDPAIRFLAASPL